MFEVNYIPTLNYQFQAQTVVGHQKQIATSPILQQILRASPQTSPLAKFFPRHPRHRSAAERDPFGHHPQLLHRGHAGRVESRRLQLGLEQSLARCRTQKHDEAGKGIFFGREQQHVRRKREHSG